MKGQRQVARRVLAIGLVSGFGWFGLKSTARADYVTIGNPHWEVALTDAGYSDYLGDNAPGFVGREYLSGEWGAAVSYTRDGTHNVAPTWFEPQFWYPDWTTNSNFVTINPITQTGTNAQGLPIAQSRIASPDLQVDLTFEMIDTSTGVQLGASPASAGGAGASVTSDRYILKQTYTLTNISDADITNLSLFQFLHSLEAQRGVYDNRNYGGTLGNYRYDITQTGRSASGDGTNLEDVISMQSSDAPASFEIGRYGIQGVDDHFSTGKPSVGTHLSVESGTLNNNDSFAPAELWIGGAEKWNLGSLPQGASTSRDVILTIHTGSVVATTDPGSAHIDDDSTGGTASDGGDVEYEFESVETPGLMHGTFDDFSSEDVDNLVDDGVFSPPTFAFGDTMQMWELTFDGQFNGDIHLIFHYDESLLPPAFDEGTLAIYHFNGDNWDKLPGIVDPFANTITTVTDSLSPFAVGFDAGPVPEPMSASLLLAGLGLMLPRRKRVAR